jgi:hypothetical protein
LRYRIIHYFTSTRELFAAVLLSLFTQKGPFITEQLHGQIFSNFKNSENQKKLFMKLNLLRKK